MTRLTVFATAIALLFISAAACSIPSCRSTPLQFAARTGFVLGAGGRVRTRNERRSRTIKRAIILRMSRSEEFRDKLKRMTPEVTLGRIEARSQHQREKETA